MIALHSWLLTNRPTSFCLYKPVEPKSRTYHGRVRAGRCTAGRRGGAELGRKRRQRVRSLRRQPSPLPSRTSRASKTTVMDVSSKARTNEILCKPEKEHNEQLIRGLFAVYSRFIRGTMAALRSWLLINEPTPICLCKPVSM